MRVDTDTGDLLLEKEGWDAINEYAKYPIWVPDLIIGLAIFIPLITVAEVEKLMGGDASGRVSR